MAYIKVNIDRLRGFNGSVEDILKNTARISDDFMSIGRRLDWDILVNTRVQKDLDRLEDQFDTERTSLKKMTEFFSYTVSSYLELENKNRDAVPSETEESGGTGEATGGVECLHGYRTDLQAHEFQVEVKGPKDLSAMEDVFEPVVVNTLGTSFGGRGNVGEDKANEKAGKIIDWFSTGATWATKLINQTFSNVVSSVTGFAGLLWNTAENASDRVSDLDRIENDETLTDDEKKYMSGVTERLSNVEAAFDALGWVTGMIPFVGGTLSKMFSAIGDGIDSDGIKSEILEETRDIENAKKQFEEADTFLGKLGALANLGAEYLESGYDITKTVVDEVVDSVNDQVVQPVVDFIEGTIDFVSDAADAVGDFVSDTVDTVGDFVSDTVDTVGDFVSDTADAIGDFVENTVVEPIVNVGNAIGNGFSWLGNKLGLW